MFTHTPDSFKNCVGWHSNTHVLLSTIYPGTQDVHTGNPGSEVVKSYLLHLDILSSTHKLVSVKN
jgi:hypothetical protein